MLFDYLPKNLIQLRKHEDDKRTFIVLPFLQNSKAGKINESNSFAECKSNGGKLFDRWERICIPRLFLGYLLVNPHDPNIENKTNVDLKVFNFQIIKIGDGTITLTMILELKWLEYRLKLNTQGSNQMISLGKEEQNHVWSPRIVMKNNAISMSREGEHFTLIMDSWCPRASLMFHLSTTINCEMDFLTFPFDEHTCKIEVSNFYDNMPPPIIFESIFSFSLKMRMKRIQI